MNLNYRYGNNIIAESGRIEMDIRLPFDKDGSKIAAVVAIAAVLLGNLSTNMGWLGFLLTISCLFFFRDPERVCRKGDSSCQPCRWHRVKNFRM